MTITRNGKKIKLTAEELEQAYREKELQYRKEDAKRQLLVLVGLEDDDDLKDPAAVKNAIESFEQYGTGKTPFDFIEDDEFITDVAKDFIDEYDCNVAENALWESVLENALYDLGE